MPTLARYNARRRNQGKKKSKERKYARLHLSLRELRRSIRAPAILCRCAAEDLPRVPEEGSQESHHPHQGHLQRLRFLRHRPQIALGRIVFDREEGDDRDQA